MRGSFNAYLDDGFFLFSLVNEWIRFVRSMKNKMSDLFYYIEILG